MEEGVGFLISDGLMLNVNDITITVNFMQMYKFIAGIFIIIASMVGISWTTFHVLLHHHSVQRET